ncbi:MAG TPA: xanthine dehydrogenase family protein molybdopterin-binding subunit [Methylomirabilota bacterium]|nr:xanthine dehydrogenase family protein molybdopterin-binding subunit [Methylomirabilota bacterium]
MLGASPKRKEDVRLLTGAGRYVDDITRPGTVRLGVVRSVHAHARLRAVDLKTVRKRPGVLAAWGAADLAGLGRVVPAAWGGSPKGKPFAVPLLAAERVRYVGEPIAVVVAEDAPRLQDALDAVGVDYVPLPPLATLEAAQRPGAPLHEGWTDNATLPVAAKIGDAEAAFARAEITVGGRFRHPRLAAAPIETRGAIAWRDPESGTLTIYASIQNPYRLRDAIAVTLALPAESVRVLVPDVGGAFGPKGDIYPDEILVAAAALRLGRPVKWIESRREDFMALGHDREQAHEARLGLTREGRIVALETSFVADVGAYPAQGDGLTANTVNHMPGPYRVPAYRGAGRSVVTTKMFNAAYRAAGRPEAVFVMERLMDLGARRLGLDPAELRRRNLIQPREMPYRPGITYKDGVQVAYDPGDFPAAFERVLTLLDYDGWRRRQKASTNGARRIGVGVACYAQGTGLGPYEGATVRVDPGGAVYVMIGVAAQGQGHATTLAQVAAGELGARYEDVTVVGGDTERFTIGMGTGGSRVAANAGPAVAGAAREVRAKAARVAAELLECAPQDVRIEASRAFVAGMPDRALPLGRLAHAAVKSKALRGGPDPTLNACTYFYPDTVTWAFGAHAAAVEVDVETGATRLAAYAIVHDPGRAINPAIVEGQLQGGAVQGLAAGLLEAIVYDDEGQLVTGSFMDYALPRADDLPPLAVALDEHRSVINPLGIKGVGESGAIAGAAVIANAIEDAVADLGVTIHEVPVTPARLRALVAAGRSPRS